MLTTAKSIQLLDASGMNISPITDITSLYYEVANSSNSSIISRKYVYTGFPVAVNITGEATSQIGVSTNTSRKRHPDDGSLYTNGQFRKIIDKDRNDDMLISRIDTSIIPGTTYRQINITNYNLSEILSYYAPLDLMDASCRALDVSINNINSSIRDINTRIHNLRTSLDASGCLLSEIVEWSNNNALIPNKFYLINDYYGSEHDTGCMKLPNGNTFFGPDIDNSLSLLVKASDSENLDGKLYEMYDNSTGNALKVYGTYKLENSKVHITYMKDQYGNEAVYDFYNLKYKIENTFYYTYSDADNNNALLRNKTNDINIENNIIKTSPFENNKMPIFKTSYNIITCINNYIGVNNDIKFIDDSIYIENIIIGNNNIIQNIYQANEFDCKNIIINNDNNITFNYSVFNHLLVENNNNITIKENQNNLTINSSNNITLYNQSNNAIIMTNNNASINLSNNVIVDGYVNTIANSSLNTTPNSVYLFKQDVYAKSFNTLK